MDLPPIQAPHPLDLAQAEASLPWHQAMEAELAASRAESWCLRAEDFFRRAQAAGIVAFSGETIVSVTPLVVPEKPKRKPVGPSDVPHGERRRELIGFEREMQDLLTEFNERSERLGSSGVAQRHGARAMFPMLETPATAAKNMAHALLGERLHAQWTARREAREIDLAAGPAAAPARPSARL